MAVEEYFDAIDKDGDGTIDEYELQKILEELGEKPKKVDILRMLNDINNSKHGRRVGRRKVVYKRSEDNVLQPWRALWCFLPPPWSLRRL